jgi:hypothetical protein
MKMDAHPTLPTTVNADDERDTDRDSHLTERPGGERPAPYLPLGRAMFCRDEWLAARSRTGQSERSRGGKLVAGRPLIEPTPGARNREHDPRHHDREPALADR